MAAASIGDQGKKVNFNKNKQKRIQSRGWAVLMILNLSVFIFFIRAITKRYGKEGKNYIENQNWNKERERKINR